MLSASIWVGVVNEGLDVRMWVLGIKDSPVSGMSTPHVCLQVLLEGLKPRYPKKSIQFILAEPKWYAVASPQPDL